ERRVGAITAGCIMAWFRCVGEGGSLDAAGRFYAFVGGVCGRRALLRLAHRIRRRAARSQLVATELADQAAVVSAYLRFPCAWRHPEHGIGIATAVAPHAALPPAQQQ